MDPSGGSVTTGPNLTGGMEPGMKQTFRPNICKAHMFVFP